MSYFPAKENWIKTFSTVATGAGAVVSSVGAIKGSALANAGAVANLVGTLLDDVPQSWLAERADKRFTKLLGVVKPALQRLEMANTTFLVGYSNSDVGDVNNTRSVTACARAIQFFKSQATRLEIGEFEFLPSALKAMFTSAAFGISALDGAVGGFGTAGILIGVLIGAFVSNAYTPRPNNFQTAAPDAATLQAYIYTDLSSKPTDQNSHLRQIEHGSAGDYKGRIAIMKFCGGLTAGAACLLGLSVTQTRSDFGHYMDNKFIPAITNAVAAGAAVGSMIATYEGKKVKSQLNIHVSTLKKITEVATHAPNLEMQPMGSALRIRHEADRLGY